MYDNRTAHRPFPAGVLFPGRVVPSIDRPVQAATTYYSIQLASFPNKKSTVQFYEKIKSQPQARIERIGKYYTARVGLWQDRSDAQAILARCTQHRARSHNQEGPVPH